MERAAVTQRTRWDCSGIVPLLCMLALCLCCLPTPAPVTAASSHSLCAGQAHRCMLNSTGQLYCWGSDSAPPWNALPVPAALASVEYSSVRCGRFFTCAIRASERTVDCFGSDQPDPATGPVALSAAIAGIRVRALTLGDYHGLILSEDGMSVYSWGHNDTGQLQLPALSDEQIALNISFRELAAGQTFSCVSFQFPHMDDVPTPRYPQSYRHHWFWPCCSGQLQWLGGDILPPQGVSLGLPFAVYRELSCAGQMCCVIGMDGVIACMGLNQYGQLNLSLSSIPYAVSVSVGDVHAVAMRLDGSIVAWGLNNGGQSSAPAGLFSSIHAGWAASCAVRADTSVQCFPSTTSPAPLSVSRCSTGEAHTCCIELIDDGRQPSAPCTFASCPTAPGPVFCFGADYSNQLTPTEPIVDAVDIAAGWSMTCVLKADGFIRCWGQLNWDEAEQARVYSTHYTQITLVGATLCMLRLDNQQMECSYGALAAPIPTQPDGSPFRWQSIITLDFHQCGLLLNSSILCWGNGGWNIQEHTPPPSQTFVQLMGGCLHVCAISTDLTLLCWGDEAHGAVPAPPIPAGLVPVRLQAGYYTGSLLLRNASDTSPQPTLIHHSWGSGAHGTANPLLQPIPSSRPVKGISFGDGFGCMIDLANKPVCFGSDHYSQCQPIGMRARVAPRHFFESGTGIQPCPAGTYSLGPGATSSLCSGPCAPGRWGAPGQQVDDQCTAACPIGSSCVLGSPAPQPCEAYTYSSSPGASACDVCSGGQWVYANRTRCGMPDCPPGSQPGDNECVSCTVGEFSPGAGVACEVCAQGFSAPYDGADHCMDCSGGASEGLSCSNTGLTILTGFFLVASPDADTLLTLRCPPAYCAGDASHSVSSMPCSANRDPSSSNLFCASCIAGYDEWNGHCVVCPSSPRWGLVFLLVCVSLAAIGLFHLLSQSSSETAALGTFSYFLQVVNQQFGALTFGGSLAWTGSLNFLQSSGGLCLAQLSPYSYAILRMMAAPIVFAELGLIAAGHFMLWSMARWRSPPVQRDADSLAGSVSSLPLRFPVHRYLRTACSLLLFVYQDVAFTSLSLLTCVGVGGSRLVFFAPGIDCADPRYATVRAMAIGLVLLGVVGIPAVVVTVLARTWRTRRHTGASSNGADSNDTAAGPAHQMLSEALMAPSPPSSPSALSPFAPFHEAFHSGAFCWQVCLLLRRLSLIGVELAVLQQSAGLKYVSFTYFHLCSLLLHSRFWPFRRSLDNQLESFALVMLTALSGALMLVNQQESNTVHALVTLMIGATAAVFVTVLAVQKVPAVAALTRRHCVACCCGRHRRSLDASDESSEHRSLDEFANASVLRQKYADEQEA